jgi:glycerol kinase
MKERYVAAIDQGTASSRCLIFDRSGNIVSVAQKEHRHIYPRPGWVEHDPLELWVNVEEVTARAIADARLEPSDLVALGIANQRETTVVWSRETGQPLHNAINWQDMRTDHLVRELNAQFASEYFRSCVSRILIVAGAGLITVRTCLVSVRPRLIQTRARPIVFGL